MRAVGATAEAVLCLAVAAAAVSARGGIAIPWLPGPGAPSPAGEAPAMAEPVVDQDEVALRAQAAQSEDGEGRNAWMLGGVALALIVAVALLGLWKTPSSELSGYLGTFGQGPKVRGLFLKLEARRLDGAGAGGRVAACYLRDATPRMLGLLTDAPVARGDRLELALGALPGYPDPGARASGHVQRVVRVDRKTEAQPWVYVRVRLDPEAAPERERLRSFIAGVRGGGGLVTREA